MASVLAKLSRIAWTLVPIVLIAGLAALYSSLAPKDLDSLAPEALRYARTALSRPIWVLAGLAVLSGIAAYVALPSAGPARQSRIGLKSVLSPLAIVDANVERAVREMLADLRADLRQLASNADPNIIVFTDVLLQGAICVGASDIHLQPLEHETRIALRVHGVLEEVITVAREHHARLITRWKVLSKLVTFKSDRPQDGHFTAVGPQGTADIRVSILPTQHGEKAVLRIARSGIDLPELASLGVPPAMLQAYCEILSKPQGMIFVTGATGSGKTTTLYASLGHIKRDRGQLTQIATIEDPVELDVPFLTQTQANENTGMTFAQGLRSILRQDPNVIMVGEIRDAETARIAIQAGLTGHLILTTLHADSAAGVFNRLIEMGVEPFLLASATLACISQRLVRTLCEFCRVPANISPQDVARLSAAGLWKSAPYAAATGCARCGGSGFLGRTALYEMLTVTPTLRELVNRKVPTATIHDAARAEGMVPLLQAGVQRAQEGQIPLSEVFRVSG